MEPGTEKPPSSDAPSPPSPKMKPLSVRLLAELGREMSPKREHVQSPEWSFPIFKQSEDISRCNQTLVQTNQPDRWSLDKTSGDSGVLQSEEGCYNQDEPESSQTSSLTRQSLKRRKLDSLVSTLRRFGGTHFEPLRRASAAFVPHSVNSFRISPKAPLPHGTASTCSHSRISEGISICSANSSPVQAPTVIHHQGPLPASQPLPSMSSIRPSIHHQPPFNSPVRSCNEGYLPTLLHSLVSPIWKSDPPNTLPPAELSHSVAQTTTLPPSSTDISERGFAVQHSSRAEEEPEEQATCSEPESSLGWSIWSEDTPTTFGFGIPTPPPSGLHNYAKSVPESGSTDLSSKQYDRYSGLQRPNSDPEGHGWRTTDYWDPVFDSLTLPASCKESNPSSAPDAVPSTGLLFSSIRESLSLPLCLPNRNRTGDADSSSSMSPWGSRGTEFDWSMQSENASGAESDYQLETETSATDLAFSPLSSFPASLPHSSRTRLRKSKRNSGCLTRCVSAPSLSEIPPPIGPHSTLIQAKSLPNVFLRSSFEDFTPEITVELNEETFWFRCSCPGLYRCSVTGLVFHMTGDGVVVYRLVPWNRRLLAQHHKQPAGPLFDIKCEQQSVLQLYLPHCEIDSTGRCRFLSVAHVEDEGVEFIPPLKVTEYHIIINIARFSAFGIIKDEESPPEPVRALVLLFYRPPSSSDLSSLLNVLLLPKNVVLRDVMHTRKKLTGDECYIETTPHCKLQPKKEYTLSTCPEDDTVLVQPAEAEFDSDNYDNYFPSFQVSLATAIKHMKLFLRDSSQCSVWERRVCLSASAVNQNRSPSDRDGPSHERLLDVRLGFIHGISGPVLKSLLDKLFEKKVIADPEREEADGMQNRRDRARFVIDTVRHKGEAASSEMIKILREDDPYLCENLGLI